MAVAGVRIDGRTQPIALPSTLTRSVSRLIEITCSENLPSCSVAYLKMTLNLQGAVTVFYSAPGGNKFVSPS